MSEEILEYILEQMTLDEKIAQLTQLTSDFFEGSNDKNDPTGPMNELGINKEIVQNCGSVIGASGAKEIVRFKENILEKVGLVFRYYLWLILSMVLRLFFQFLWRLDVHGI